MVVDEAFPFIRDATGPGRSELSALRPARVPAATPLLRRGDPAGGAYLVLAGALRVFYVTDNGREATLYHVAPGETCVLALGATYARRPYPAWVEASHDGCTFVCVETAVFHRLLDSESSFRHFVMASMSARIFDLMCALEELATASIEQRVAGYLAKQARGGDSVVVTQAALAAELGTAREVVFRAVRGLRNAGLVSTARGRVHVVDPAGLAAAAAGRRAPPE